MNGNDQTARHTNELRAVTINFDYEVDWQLNWRRYGGSYMSPKKKKTSSMILSLSELSQIFKNNSTFVVNSVTWKIHYAASNIPYYSLHTLGNHRQLERWNDMYIMHGCCWTLIATGARIKQQNTQTSILYAHAENLLPTWALNKYALHTMQRTGSLLLRVCLQLTNRYIFE